MNQMSPQQVVDIMMTRMRVVVNNIEKLEELSEMMAERGIEPESADITMDMEVVTKFMETLEDAGRAAAKYNKLRKLADLMEIFIIRFDAADQAETS